MTRVDSGPKAVALTLANGGAAELAKTLGAEAKEHRVLLHVAGATPKARLQELLATLP